MCSMPLRANARAAVAKGPRMQYSPVPTPEGTKETYWETKAPSSEVPAMCRAISCALCRCFNASALGVESGPRRVRGQRHVSRC